MKSEIEHFLYSELEFDHHTRKVTTGIWIRVEQNRHTTWTVAPLLQCIGWCINVSIKVAFSEWLATVRSLSNLQSAETLWKSHSVLLPCFPKKKLKHCTSQHFESTLNTPKWFHMSHMKSLAFQENPFETQTDPTSNIQPQPNPNSNPNSIPNSIPTNQPNPNPIQPQPKPLREIHPSTRLPSQFNGTF